MQIDIISIFPGMFQGPFSESILRRAEEMGSVTIRLHDLREYATDKHRQVDDYPFGGGAGMVLKPEPLYHALESIKGEAAVPVILTAANGTPYTQARAHELSLLERMIIICGHYKGIDQRVIDRWVDEEISLGDFVLTGGEIPAMAIVDSVVRLQPGVLGDEDSARSDSFEDGLLEEPLFTRPAEYRGREVPEILLSGHHANIAAWREEERLKRTLQRRSDLLDNKKRRE
ncbi:MAG: tRNA (guanosine(37)-N1)-methyltransferase TrmD [Candidatus Delongbacteria bacterium]|nr:tRNA (guanosine(37)-N1)-methyltransferase TrmD [Candidatus Delongbacteria bacterium]